MSIRPEQPEDAPVIDALLRAAFGGDQEARLVQRLRAEPGFDARLSLVFVDVDRVVGHILFSPIFIESATARTDALALAPLAVRPDVQRQGIGTALAREGLEVCRALGHGIVVVVGEPAYYSRFGFLPAGNAGVRAPFPVPDEVFQILELRASALAGVSGVVRYPPAFTEVV
ncbi:MAG: N-acetyltransferase [Planctomycetes bacterium]|nr:N-acetyltransferase [Planctomycetota bacterium]